MLLLFVKDENRFTGQIPSEIGELEFLHTLLLGMLNYCRLFDHNNNVLAHIFLSIFMLRPKDKNELSGPIPVQIGNNSKLTLLFLGRVTIFYFYFMSLFRVFLNYHPSFSDLDENELTGTLPTELGRLSFLEIMSFCECHENVQKKL